MDYKETVMSEEKISKALQPYWHDSEICPHCKAVRRGGYLLSPEERDGVVAEAQAKITWPIAEKAGIKKVVDWFENHGYLHLLEQYVSNVRVELQAFLKELGK